MVYGIGGMRPWSDPRDPRKTVGPRPMGPAGLGMPSGNPLVSAYSVPGRVENVRTGEISDSVVMFPRIAPTHGGSGYPVNTLSRVDSSARLPLSVYGPGGPPQKGKWTREDASIRDVVRGLAESATVVDPQLYVGSVARGTARPGNVSQTLTRADLLANPLQTAGGSIGVTTEEAKAVYRDLIDPPNIKGRRLHPMPGQPNTYGLFRSGDMFVDPTDSRTNLPSDLPLHLRGNAGVGASERNALMTDASGFSSEDLSRARTSERTGRRPVGAISGDDVNRAVPVAVVRPDGTFGVEYLDPTREIRNIEIPIDQRMSSYNSDAQDYETLSGLAGEIRREARAPLMPRSAVVAAKNSGRYAPLPLDRRDGTMVGHLQGTSRQGETTTPVYAPVDRSGDPITIARNIPSGRKDSIIEEERAFRLGSPTNIDIEGVARPQLAEILAEAGHLRRGLVPAGAPNSRERARNTVRLGDLEEMVRDGMAVTQRGAGSLDPDQLRQLATSIRLRPSGEDRPTLYVTRPPSSGAQGPAELVDILLPEVQQDPRVMTGSFVKGVVGDIGPALLSSNPYIRRDAEAYLQRQGYEQGETTIGGLLNALTSGGQRPPQSGLDAPASASPVVQMLARGVVPAGAGQVPAGVGYRLMPDGINAYSGRATAEQLAGALPPSGSYGSRLLMEDIHDYLQGQVPMSQITQALQLRQQVPEPMGRVMPDPMAPQGPTSTYYPGGGGIQAPLQQAAAAASFPVGDGSRQLQIHRALRGADGQLIGVRPMTGQSPYAPSYIDDVAAYMAANAPAARIVDRTPQGAQLELDLAGATARNGQLELPIAVPTPVQPSAAALGEAALRRAYAGAPEAGPPYVWPVSDWAASTSGGERLFGDTQVQRPWQLRADPDQLGVSFRDIASEVVPLPPARAGRGAGPYAGAPIYRAALDRSRYQSSLSGDPNFDYADMARRSGAGGRYGPVVSRLSKVQDTPAGIVSEVRNVYGPSPDNLGMEVGSPAQELALAQLAMRIRARQQGLA